MTAEFDAWRERLFLSPDNAHWRVDYREKVAGPVAADNVIYRDFTSFTTECLLRSEQTFARIPTSRRYYDDLLYRIELANPKDEVYSCLSRITAAHNFGPGDGHAMFGSCEHVQTLRYVPDEYQTFALVYEPLEEFAGCVVFLGERYLFPSLSGMNVTLPRMSVPTYDGVIRHERDRRITRPRVSNGVKLVPRQHRFYFNYALGDNGNCVCAPEDAPGRGSRKPLTDGVRDYAVMSAAPHGIVSFHRELVAVLRLYFTDEKGLAPFIIKEVLSFILLVEDLKELVKQLETLRAGAQSEKSFLNRMTEPYMDALRTIAGIPLLGKRPEAALEESEPKRRKVVVATDDAVGVSS
jgi:hypothetical protein